MSSFRRKILLTHLILFLVFLALMFPFASQSMGRIAINAMNTRADELIAKIQAAPSEEALARRLKNQKHLTFFRVTVISQDRTIVYDSHTQLMMGPRFTQEFLIDHPDVAQAFKEGVGYSVNYSDLLGQKFTYLAKAFPFQGSTYVLRVAFPHQYLQEISRSFEIGFFAMSALVLLAFSVMTWAIVHRLTAPIQQIIDAIRPYHQGTADEIPEITLKTSDSRDDFVQLAHTLNNLSLRVRGQIDSLKQERNEKAAILDSLNEGVIAVDEHLTITYVNPRALDLLQFTKDELLSAKFIITRLPQCQELLEKCLDTNQTQCTSLEVKRGPARLFLNAVAVPNGRETGAILVLLDTSAERKMVEMRKDFVANASHELKTPITVIRGFAETLHDHPELSPDTTQDITAKMMRHCDRMNRLVLDLLTLADIENLPASRFHEVDVLALVQECQKNLLEAHPEILFFFQCEEAVLSVLGDRGLLHQALMNLMENAVRYSPTPAQVTVILERVGDWIRIVVADKGIGIPEADLEHIFERFYTVNKSKSQKLGGSGLGLSIVETIIEKHSGRVWAESKVGEGSQFVIEMPRRLAYSSYAPGGSKT